MKLLLDIFSFLFSPLVTPSSVSSPFFCTTNLRGLQQAQSVLLDLEILNSQNDALSIFFLSPGPKPKRKSQILVKIQLLEIPK